MDTGPIIDHLKGQLAGFRKVGGAADLAAIGGGAPPAPAAYVLPATELPGDSEVATTTIQRVVAVFSVVLAVSNKSNAEGEAAVRDLEPRRDQLKAALLGWAPAAGFGPVSFAGGRLVSFDDAVLFWMDDFKTYYYLRSTQ